LSQRLNSRWLSSPAKRFNESILQKQREELLTLIVSGVYDPGPGNVIYDAIQDENCLLSATLTTCSRTRMQKYIGCSPRARMGTGYWHRRSRPVLARSSGSQDPSVPVASPHCTSPSSPIRSGRCAFGERKSRHDMAGFAKGMATTSWTVVRCDCRNKIHQVSQQRVARARRRWLPQPVHGGCNVQDRTRASNAHAAGDSNIFFPSVDAAARRDWRAPKGSTCEPTTFKLQ
jgi:hypothetical protein